MNSHVPILSYLSMTEGIKMASIFFSRVFPRKEGETKKTSTKYPEHLKPMPRWSAQGCTRITYRKPSFSSSPLYSAVVIAATHLGSFAKKPRQSRVFSRSALQQWFALQDPYGQLELEWKAVVTGTGGRSVVMDEVFWARSRPVTFGGVF